MPRTPRSKSRSAPEPFNSSAQDKLTSSTDSKSLSTRAPAPSRTADYYVTRCQHYHLNPNAGLLVGLRFRQPVLRPASRPIFSDIDLLPLADTFLSGDLVDELTHVQGMDFSKSALTSHGATVLSQILQTNSHITSLRISNQKIGAHGAHQLEQLFKTNQSLKVLAASNCAFGSRGGPHLASILSDPSHQLRDLDVSNNMLGNRALIQCHAALQRRADLGCHEIHCDFDGNQVLAEILNSGTHFIGLLFCILGFYKLMALSQSPDQPSDQRREMLFWPCLIFCTSLCTLYLSSALYHSVFMFKSVKKVFQVFDHAAIFVLIAGTYTPILSIVFHAHPFWSMYLLYFMWLMCAVGVLLTAFYKRENRKWVLLAMYLTMGWSALICLPDLIHEFSSAGLNWILAGGLFYTTGVIFFVRDYHLDHMVWHLFVFAGSACHWWCIYKYLVTPGALELQAQYPSANFPISLIKMKIQNHVA